MNISQMELSKKIHVAISTIRNYEMKENPRKPTAKIYIKLAEFFNVSVEYLMYDDIENTTMENVKINEILGLSDEAIKLLKETKEYKYNFNDFIKEFDFKKFLKKWSK